MQSEKSIRLTEEEEISLYIYVSLDFVLTESCEKSTRPRFICMYVESILSIQVVDILSLDAASF